MFEEVLEEELLESMSYFKDKSLGLDGWIIEFFMFFHDLVEMIY